MKIFTNFINTVDNKRMASEIPTHMLNQKNSIIPDLKFTFRDLVICGFSNTVKIFTKNKIIFLVLNNSEFI